MFRLIWLGAVAAALALGAPSVAAGDPPIHDRYDLPQDFVWEACGFPVRVQIDGTATDILFFDDDGAFDRSIGTGSFTAVLTNLATTESLRLNIPGPLFVDVFPDGSRIVTIRGPWVLLYRPETLESPTVVPWLYLFTGERILVVAPDGSRTVTWRGRFVDLCAKLAA